MAEISGTAIWEQNIQTPTLPKDLYTPKAISPQTPAGLVVALSFSFFGGGVEDSLNGTQWF